MLRTFQIIKISKANAEKTYVCSIVFVDHQPIQADIDTLDDAVWYGIRCSRCMDYVGHMDFDSFD